MNDGRKRMGINNQYCIWNNATNNSIGLFFYSYRFSEGHNTRNEPKHFHILHMHLFKLEFFFSDNDFHLSCRISTFFPSLSSSLSLSDSFVCFQDWFIQIRFANKQEIWESHVKYQKNIHNFQFILDMIELNAFIWYQWIY